MSCNSKEFLELILLLGFINPKPVFAKCENHHKRSQVVLQNFRVIGNSFI